MNFNKNKYNLIQYSNEHSSKTHCMQVCSFQDTKSNMRATVINVHLYVPRSPRRPNGEILEELADTLKKRFQADDFVLFIGDMNLRAEGAPVWRGHNQILWSRS